MKKMLSKAFAPIKQKLQEDRLGFLLLSCSYAFICLSIISIPMFTYREEYTFVTNILCVLASLSIVLYLFFRGKFYINYYVLCLLLFLLYAFTLTMFTTKGFGMPRIQSLLTLYGYVFCLIEFWFNKKAEKYFITTICVASILFTISFIIVYRENIVNMDFDQRFGEDFGNVNTICSIFMFGIMFLVYSALKIKKWAYLLLVPTVVMVFCALITGSRWGLVSLVVGLILLLYQMIGKRYKIEFIFGTIMLVLLVIVILQLPVFAEYKKHFKILFDFITVGTRKQGSVDARTAMFFDGLKLWFRNIFIGYGADGFKAHTSYGMYSHSSIIELLTNFGLIGFLFFYFPLVKMIVNSKSDSVPLFKLSRGMAILLIVYSFFAICHNSKFGISCLSIFIGADFIYNSEKQFYYSLSFFQDKKFSLESKFHYPEEPAKIVKKVRTPASLKIAFVISSLYRGGAERVASILANEWVASGHKVTFYLTSSPIDDSYYLDERIKVVNTATKKRSKFFPSVKINELYDAIKCDKPDVIVSFLTTPSYYASRVAKSLNIPFVTSERNDPSKVKNIIYRIMRNSTYKTANHVVFQGENAESYFSKSIQKKSSIILNPVIVKDVTNNKTEKVVVSAGRLEWDKGFDVLIKAFSIISDRCPDYSLKIFGKGSKKKQLQSEINSLKMDDRIQLLPFSDNIHKEVASSSVYVLSSRHEGMPNSLCEALLLGIPSVATDCPIGLSSVLIEDNHNGVVCKTDDCFSLAIGMYSVISGISSFKKAAKEKKAYYKELFDPARLSSDWISLFKNVIKESRENDKNDD